MPQHPTHAPLQGHETHSGDDDSVTAALTVSTSAAPFGLLGVPQHLVLSGSLSGAYPGGVPCFQLPRAQVHRLWGPGGGLACGTSSHYRTQHSPSWGPCQHFLSDSALPLSLACVRIGGSWLQAGGMGPDATGRGRHRRGNQADRRGHGGRCSVLVLGQGRAWGLGMGTGGRERGGQALQGPRGGDRVGLG